jgi:hypothetical protein
MQRNPTVASGHDPSLVRGENNGDGSQALPLRAAMLPEQPGGRRQSSAMVSPRQPEFRRVSRGKSWHYATEWSI